MELVEVLSVFFSSLVHEKVKKGVKVYDIFFKMPFVRK